MVDNHPAPMRALHLSEIRNLRDLANLVEEDGLQLVSRERRDAPVEESAAFTKAPQPGLFQPVVATETGHPEIGRPRRVERQIAPMIVGAPLGRQVMSADPRELWLRRIEAVFSRPLVTGAAGTFTLETPEGPYLVIFTDPRGLMASAPNVPWRAVSPDVVLRSLAGGQFAGVVVDPNTQGTIELSRRQILDLFG